MSRAAASRGIDNHNVKYVVQMDNCNPPGEDLASEPWPKGSKTVRAAIVISTLILLSAASYLWWNASIGDYAEAEEALDGIPIDDLSEHESLVEMETAFLDFEDIAAKKGWKKLFRAEPTAQLEMTIALNLRNVELLEERLIAAATPGNPEYGKWMSKEEVESLTSPEWSKVEAVLEWFGANAEDYHSGGFIRRVVSVAEAEALLNSNYYVLEHTTGRQVIRMISSYSISSTVASHISFLTPSIRLPARSEMEPRVQYEEIPQDPGDGDPKKGDPIDAELNSAPFYLRTLYNVTEQGTVTGNKQAVAEFLTQIFSQPDQNTFYNRFYPEGRGTIITIAGRSTTQAGYYAGIETMLDTEYITVTGTGIETENWSYMFDPSVTSRQTCPFIDWILDVGAADDAVVPKVFSVSYGEDETDLSPSYAIRLNTEFMKAGARGISILFASGDSGSNCERETFVPGFPGGLPYVTAVGATRGAEEITSWHLSSGGFSNIFARPSWQDAHVSKYLEVDGVMEMAEQYGVNTNGRAFPDVSAMGVGYPVVCQGVAYLVSGTSCASPTFAGIIALLNDHRLKNGKSTLGFLNPWLYSTDVSDVLVDVNYDYSTGCTAVGWSAAEGWDAVTGLGYPNYGLLRDLL